ncbi:hypothetical protein [Marinicauda pacifica]|uniref:hypothetical protein n=1 Tax=Marinicauda pacifica TaxID=1133559 RepID=UPI0035C8218D
MLRILVTATLILLGTVASAAAQDAARVAELADTLKAEAEGRAQTLAEAPGAPSAAIEPSDPFATGVQDFAGEAIRLSRHIEAVGGPMDLKCIFKGMSEDALSRLDALAEPARNGERARTYHEFAGLFEDAAIIARDSETQAVASLPCPVEAE